VNGLPVKKACFRWNFRP